MDIQERSDRAKADIRASIDDFMGDKSTIRDYLVKQEGQCLGVFKDDGTIAPAGAYEKSVTITVYYRTG